VDENEAWTSYHLRVWRACEQLTQAQAAKVLGVSRQTVIAWEAGKYPEDLRSRMQAASDVLKNTQS
jgi:DNA-binding XRE family transcriptional regulator